MLEARAQLPRVGTRAACARDARPRGAVQPPRDEQPERARRQEHRARQQHRGGRAECGQREAGGRRADDLTRLAADDRQRVEPEHLRRRGVACEGGAPGHGLQLVAERDQEAHPATQRRGRQAGAVRGGPRDQHHPAHAFRRHGQARRAAAVDQHAEERRHQDAGQHRHQQRDRGAGRPAGDVDHQPGVDQEEQAGADLGDADGEGVEADGPGRHLGDSSGGRRRIGIPDIEENQIILIRQF